MKWRDWLGERKFQLRENFGFLDSDWVMPVSKLEVVGEGGRDCGLELSDGKDGKSVGLVTGFTGLVFRISENFFRLGHSGEEA